MLVASQVRSLSLLPKVTVVGGLAVNRAAQIELVNDVRRLEAEYLVDGLDDLLIGNLAGAKRVHIHADRVGITDGVSELHFALVGELGGDNVLRNPAAHVSGAAVHLRRIFAGERAAAVTTRTAVAVHDDLAAGQTGVALRSADDETTGGIDETFRFRREQFRGQNFLDHLLDAEFFNLRVLDIRRVLRGDDDVGNGNRLAVFINDRDLRLRVRTQPSDFAALANSRKLAAEAVRKHDRRGHQLRRFIRRVTEHQALVTGALLRGLLALGLFGIHALRDVERLLRDDDVDENLVRMKHIVVVDVADFADGVARDLDEIELGLRGDLTANDGDVRLHVGFAGDAAELVLCEAGVQHGVRNGVGDLVRMAFADGLGRKDVTVAHNYFGFTPTTY